MVFWENNHGLNNYIITKKCIAFKLLIEEI